MRKQMMLVSAVPGKLQPNFEAFDAGVRRFIGWRFDSTVGDVDEKGIPQGGFVMTEPELVPIRAEYIRALKAGDIAPADDISAHFIR